jgi:aminoglycoside phosphotransferase (APT) family kinase protein
MRNPTVTVSLSPDDRVAADLAAAAVGSQVRAVRRFTNGVCHYVYEVTFVDHSQVVVRIAPEADRLVVGAAARLSRLLRPVGVPLPQILAEDVGGRHPHLVLERFAGTDLGNVMNDIGPDALDEIAAKVAHAQTLTSTLPSASRYGYAASPHEAPYRSWSQVVDANLRRSESRITTAGLFGTDAIRSLAGRVADARHELDRIPPTPFLHDTTRKNVIVTSTGGFSGIVDVDELCFGDPRYPVALTLAAILAFGGPVTYVDSWMRHARFADDRLFRLYVALFLVEFMGEHGLTNYTIAIDSTASQRASLFRLFTHSIRRIDQLGP